MDTSPNRYRNITHDIRIVGVDDGAFRQRKGAKEHASLVAVLVEELKILTVKIGRIEVDGKDANSVLASLLRGMNFDAAMLSGIAFGGFNVVDIARLSTEIRRPVIALTGEKPDNKAVLKALRDHFADWKERWAKIKAAGRIHRCKPLQDEPGIYFEVRGAPPSLARKWIRLTATISRLPEPIRVARILARAVSTLS